MSWLLSAEGTFCSECGYRLSDDEELTIKDLYEKVKCPICEKRKAERSE